MKLVLAAGVLALLLVACGSPRRAEPIVGPMRLDATERHGQAVYQQHCFKCHSQGEGALGPAINDKPLPKFLMRTQVRLGFGVMPSFSESQISDEDLDAMLDYLVALRRAGR